ncbi:MAG: four helix bundle protein [Lewinellaceae bacterium]|jgi:four helix bundle protein|nr:four helix bundle protein [Lewinellaceae bacterium]
MFDFEKLEVYQIARQLNRDVLKFIFAHPTLDPYLKDQWKRCMISSVLNLSEGTGRVSDADKKHFFTIARGSIFECTTLLQIVKDLDQIDDPQYQKFYAQYEQVSKMLLGMYRSKT